MFKLEDDETNNEVAILTRRTDGALGCSFKTVPPHVRIVNYFGATEKGAYSNIERFSFHPPWIADHDLKEGQKLSFYIKESLRNGTMIDIMYLYKVN